jgi:hypothetical protein
MVETEGQIISGYPSANAFEAVNHLSRAIAQGRHWYPALLEAMGLWTDAEEVHNGRLYRYLIDGEAFDWLLLAERLCEAVSSLVPEEERDALLFHGRPPLSLSHVEVKRHIGVKKYHQYLNYFYGITVEGILLLAVQEDIERERSGLGYRSNRDIADEAYERVYDLSRAELLKCFRHEKKYPALKSMTLTEIKELTYWLFKYRLKKCEKAKMASDTKKALDYLKRLGNQQGVLWTISAEGAAD